MGKFNVKDSQKIECSFDHAEAEVNDDLIVFYRCFQGIEGPSFFEEFFDMHLYDADPSKVKIYLDILEDVYIFKRQGYQYKILDKLEEKYKKLFFEQIDGEDQTIPDWVWKYGLEMIMKQRRKDKENEQS